MTGRGRIRKAVNFPVHGLFLLFCILLAALPSGCGPKRLAEILPGLPERGHHIEGVPFFRQTEHACGPAALASVLARWGRPADLADLTRKVVIPKLQGALPMDLERAAREAGLSTSTRHGDRDLIFAALRKDLPVIALLDLGLGPVRRPHYVVLTGFDDGNRLFILHDGATPDRTMAYRDFERSWERAGKWMLVAEP